MVHVWMAEPYQVAGNPGRFYVGGCRPTNTNVRSWLNPEEKPPQNSCPKLS